MCGFGATTVLTVVSWQGVDNQESTVTSYLISFCMCVYLCVQPLGWRLALCGPVDCRLPGSFVHGILEARTQGWAPRLLLPDPGMASAPLPSPAPAGGFFTTSVTWKACICTQHLINEIGFFT